MVARGSRHRHARPHRPRRASLPPVGALQAHPHVAFRREAPGWDRHPGDAGASRRDRPVHQDRIHVRRVHRLRRTGSLTLSFVVMAVDIRPPVRLNASSHHKAAPAAGRRQEESMRRSDFGLRVVVVCNPSPSPPRRRHRRRPPTHIRPAGDTEIQPDLSQLPPDVQKVYAHIDETSTRTSRSSRSGFATSISDSGEGIPRIGRDGEGLFRRTGLPAVAGLRRRRHGVRLPPGNPVVYAKCDGAEKTVLSTGCTTPCRSRSRMRGRRRLEARLVSGARRC